MKYYYGFITDGWGFIDENDSRVNLETMIELTEEEYISLFEGQAEGLEIVYYNGEVFNAEPNLYYVDGNNVWQKRTEEEAEDISRQKERQRLDLLTLTPADVERALYKAKQMDFDDLKILIAQALPTVDIKALSIEFRAKDFYRGAVANGMRLFDVVGALIGYTSEDMDYLFEHKELPEKEEPEPTPEPDEGGDEEEPTVEDDNIEESEGL